MLESLIDIFRTTINEQLSTNNHQQNDNFYNSGSGGERGNRLRQPLAVAYIRRFKKVQNPYHWASYYHGEENV